MSGLLGFGTRPGLIDNLHGTRLQASLADFGHIPNYLNPFNPSTTIKYQLPAASEVNITITASIGMAQTTTALTWRRGYICIGSKRKVRQEMFLRTKKLVLVR